MSQKEKIKALIDFYKAIIVAFMTALFGVLSYTFINYKNYTIHDTIIILLCIFGLLSTLIVLVKLFLKEINKLEKEKE
ncbi:hypothetical protein [Helicobacter pullorum]|uniref:Uncharacterized protein n=1 Tax=Helicobacter pullorum TaxID=35818 RepID=A0A0N0LRA2_9HELI|nr:hypothetical protein [Helicobacter pullorum]KPH51813.1 hypothetical protein HPU229254_05230 [Helicobacter pullorum]KPH55155.1 hypothetical protein HPU229334_09965 [Helicobacter pullorum]